MRRHTLRASTAHIVPILLALALTGCFSNETPRLSAAIDHGTEAGSPWAFFLDTGDDGNDPWTPGCHYKCTDAECSGETRFWGGDFCSGNDLQEWTNAGPHAAASDIARHSCSEACVARGASGGRCVVVEKACDGTYQSSRCECD